MFKSLLILVALPFLSGCVAWEIRDDLRMANFQINDIKCDLEKMQGQLTGVKTTLDATNEELVQVKTALGITNDDLDITNTALGTVYERLRLLHSIDASMTKLDGHLASLRRTISSLDDMIPFVEFGDEAPPPAPAPAAAEAGNAAPGTSTADGAPAPTGEPAVPRRNPLLGTWICEYPKGHDTALLLLDETRCFYVTSNGGKLPATWTINENTLTFTFEPRTVKNPDGTSQTTTPVRVWKIITRSPRTVTLEQDGIIEVFARP